MAASGNDKVNEVNAYDQPAFIVGGGGESRDKVHVNDANGGYGTQEEDAGARQGETRRGDAAPDNQVKIVHAVVTDAEKGTPSNKVTGSYFNLDLWSYDPASLAQHDSRNPSSKRWKLCHFAKWAVFILTICVVTLSILSTYLSKIGTVKSTKYTEEL